MTLKLKLQTDLIEAMKARDESKVSALRMLKAAVMKFEVAGVQKIEATDEEILKIMQKEVKQREDSIEQFEKGGRADLVEIEKKQMEVLKAYLPQQLSDEELQSKIQEVILEIGAKGPQEMGKVMGMAMKKVAGQADGNRVRSLVEKELSN